MNNNLSVRNEPAKIYVKPIADVYETEKEFHFDIEMPGVDKDNIDINYGNGVLSIKGKQGDEEHTDHSGYYRSVSFERKFSLGKDINADLIKANMEHAVLHVTVPKEATQAPKQVTVS